MRHGVGQRSCRRRLPTARDAGQQRHPALKHEAIQNGTELKAKEALLLAERIINLGKRGGLAMLLWSVPPSWCVLDKVFSQLKDVTPSGPATPASWCLGSGPATRRRWRSSWWNCCEPSEKAEKKEQGGALSPCQRRGPAEQERPVAEPRVRAAMTLEYCSAAARVAGRTWSVHEPADEWAAASRGLFPGRGCALQAVVYLLLLQVERREPAVVPHEPAAMVMSRGLHATDRRQAVHENDDDVDDVVGLVLET